MALGHRAVEAAVVSSIFAALGTIAVALRLWTRLVIIRAPGIEDAIIVASWMCAVVTVITIGMQIVHGLGEHVSTLSGDDTTQLLFNFYISISTYCASIGLTKTAILVQYLRVFPTRTFQIWCWAFIFIVVAYTIATVFACIFVCIPVQSFWNGDPNGKCINELASWFSNAAINIVTDLMIIVLPMPVIKNLNLARRQKKLLMGIFAFGGIVCIISIVRLHSLLVATRSKDTTYDNGPVATFSVVEINISIICCCLPCLRPLIARWIPGLSSTHSRGTDGSSGYKRSSMYGRGMQLNTIGSKRGVERLEDVEEEDKIHVVTVVDVQVGDQRGGIKEREREDSTETLFRIV